MLIWGPISPQPPRAGGPCFPTLHVQTVPAERPLPKLPLPLRPETWTTTPPFNYLSGQEVPGSIRAIAPGHRDDSVRGAPSCRISQFPSEIARRPENEKTRQGSPARLMITPIHGDCVPRYPWVVASQPTGVPARLRRAAATDRVNVDAR